MQTFANWSCDAPVGRKETIFANSPLDPVFCLVTIDPAASKLRSNSIPPHYLESSLWLGGRRLATEEVTRGTRERPPSRETCQASATRPSALGKSYRIDALSARPIHMTPGLDALPDAMLGPVLFAVGKMVGLRKQAAARHGLRERNFLPFNHFEPANSRIGVTFTLDVAGGGPQARPSDVAAKPFVAPTVIDAFPYHIRNSSPGPRCGARRAAHDACRGGRRTYCGPHIVHPV